MAANTQPVFPLTSNTGVAATGIQCILTTAMTNTKAFDGTDTAGTALALFYTAGAAGSKIDSINIRLTSTNGTTVGTTSTATLVRLWLNNGSANTTATNNILIGEVAVPATTLTALGTSVASLISTLTSANSIPVSIPAGYKLYAGITVAPGTGCAVAVSAFGGDF